MYVFQERNLQNMKIWAIAVGIILLLATPIILSTYQTAYGTVSTTPGPWPQNRNSWEYSGNFSASEIILAQFSPNMFWFNDTRAFDMPLNDTTPIMYVDINITDPENGQSHYELWYTYDVTNPSRYGLYNATMDYAAPGINKTVHLAPNFNIANGLVLGAAEYNGTYLANVTFVGYAIDFRADGRFPPASFVLNWAVTTLQKSYPYTNMVYANFFTIPVSIMFLIYGLRKTRSMPKAYKKDMRLQRSR